MTIRDYLQKCNTSTRITFIVARAIEDEDSLFYHDEYYMTSVLSKQEWLNHELFIDSHIIINQDHPPIDVTGSWIVQYKYGLLQCAMITTKEELIKRYGEIQGRQMIEFYNQTIC